jgi:hypothetical protein
VEWGTEEFIDVAEEDKLICPSLFQTCSGQLLACDADVNVSFLMHVLIRSHDGYVLLIDLGYDGEAWCGTTSMSKAL